MFESPEPFPWHQFSALRAADVDLQRAAMQAVENHIALERLGEAVNQLFLLEMSGVGIQRCRVTAERRHLGTVFSLRSGSLVISLSFEPPMVAQVLRRVMGQPPRIDSGAKLGPAATGAAVALLTELGRRLARTEPLLPDLSLHQEGRAAPIAVGAQRALTVDFWVQLDGVSYVGFAAISVLGPPPRRQAVFAERADVPIALPLVVARCVLDADDYHSLCLGDVVIPEEPTPRELLLSSVQGKPLPADATAHLRSPGASRGLQLCVKNGKLCLAGATNLSYDAPVANHSVNKPGPVPEPKGGAPEATVADVIMDAPVVVHLELGSVSLPAHTWLGLKTGDVVCSELPVGRPVTLRVADRVVAEGELVTVDGTVGVRIQRFFKA